MGLELQEQHTDSTYTIKFKPVETSVYRDGVWITNRVDDPSLIAVIVVKPGMYALKKLGGKSLGASPLTQPFVVEAGKAYFALPTAWEADVHQGITVVNDVIVPARTATNHYSTFSVAKRPQTAVPSSFLSLSYVAPEASFRS